MRMFGCKHGTFPSPCKVCEERRIFVQGIQHAVKRLREMAEAEVDIDKRLALDEAADTLESEGKRE